MWPGLYVRSKWRPWALQSPQRMMTVKPQSTESTRLWWAWKPWKPQTPGPWGVLKPQGFVHPQCFGALWSLTSLREFGGSEGLCRHENLEPWGALWSPGPSRCFGGFMKPWAFEEFWEFQGALKPWSPQSAILQGALKPQWFEWLCESWGLQSCKAPEAQVFKVLQNLIALQNPVDLRDIGSLKQQSSQSPIALSSSGLCETLVLQGGFGALKCPLWFEGFQKPPKTAWYFMWLLQSP